MSNMLRKKLTKLPENTSNVVVVPTLNNYG